MMKLAGFLLLVFLATASFADYWQSGDGGTAFATDLSTQKCKEPNVSAVFVCSGNVVKVLSTNYDEGITFYKPDGSMVYCPQAAPADMGAECVQLLTPNLCPPDSVCPPSNGTNIVTQPPQQRINQTELPPQGQNPPSNNATPQKNETIEATKENQTGGIGDFWVYGIILVGMIIIAMLNYIYFKTRGTGTS